jgi:hypothetical protein
MRRSALATVALVAAVAAAGCGDDQARSPSAGAKPVGDESAGTTVQFANCGDWQRGSDAERYATVEALRGQLTPQRSKTAASPLPDERAKALLDKTCSTPNVASLRLYKLYVRMQGFAPLVY